MFKSIRYSLQSFPLKVIIWKVSNKVFRTKIPKLREWQNDFNGKHGIEIGGPSRMFSVQGYFPLYPVLGKLDGVNFSKYTVWEGALVEGYNYKYYNKTGYQYIAEGDNLENINAASYDFVLSCNNLEHMANPLVAVFEWKRILKERGLMLLILPNKEANFDHRRPYTTMQHLMDDYNNKTGENDMTHKNEILELHHLRRDPNAKTYQYFVSRCNNNFENRCMHHHVFSQNLLKEMLQFCGLNVLRQYSSYTDHFILASKN
jgi:SAM-dependent methyltransferase